jgi:hypothetical protein
MKSQLFCTFSNSRDYEADLIQICSTYDIMFNKIYALRDVDNDYQIYLTYNGSCEAHHDWLPRTISMHRKKHTNTLYTINGLNEIVSNETGGQKDENYKIDWEKYRNSIILTSDDGIRIISTKLFKIINL